MYARIGLRRSELVFIDPDLQPPWKVIRAARRTLKSEQWVPAQLTMDPDKGWDFGITDRAGLFGGMVQPAIRRDASLRRLQGMGVDVQLAGPHQGWFVVRSHTDPTKLVVARAIFLPHDPRFTGEHMAHNGPKQHVTAMNVTPADLWVAEAKERAARYPNDAHAQFLYGRYLAESNAGGQRELGLALIERAIDMDRTKTLYVRTWLSLARASSEAYQEKAADYRGRVKESWM